MSDSKPPTPPADKGGDKAAACTTEECPLKKIQYEIVEIVEVVSQDTEKWVQGVAMDPTDLSPFSGSVVRADKDGSDGKQYINLEHDVETKAKRHPEYGRAVVLRARIKRKDGAKENLAGVNVDFSFKRTDGPDRTDPPGEPAVWVGTDLVGNEKEGYGSANGTAKTSAASDDKGWTSAVWFYLSQLGGDKFEMSAKLAPGTNGDTAKEVKTPNKYVVWRRFWYQMTYATGYNPPQPTAAEGAYKTLAAEMVKANTKVYTKADLPADLQDRTFYPEFHFKQGGGNSQVGVIGSHNKDEFAKMHVEEIERPYKAHLIICEQQCDPRGASAVGVHKLVANNAPVTLGAGTGGNIISKPALKSGALVIVGEWGLAETPWTKGGDLTDANIEIDAARASTLTVNIKLPAAAPAPTAAAPVFVKLQLNTAKGFLGESFGKGQILCVYRPTAAAGKPGSEVDYNDTVAHEEGHMWHQTATPGNQPASLKNHPLQHVGHGGSGSHCRHGATVAAGAVNWQDATEKTPEPQSGDCISFFTYSASCSHKFCPVCARYLRLQDMTKWGH